LSDETNPFQTLLIGGTEVHYGVLCVRKLWWFVHGMELELSSDRVAEGRLLQEEAYDGRRRDLMLDGALRIDGLDVEGEGVEAVVTVHEVKMSRGARRAQRLQLLYYLYSLQQRGVERVRGVLEYPGERRRETVLLTPQGVTEVEETLQRVQEVRVLPSPPDVPEPMPICKKCAYQELCWG
jgi:CRISPR-associated exonuclease Cas4